MEIGLLISSLHVFEEVNPWRILFYRIYFFKFIENRHKETNLLRMNFTKIEHVFVGCTWKRYKYFPIDGANASGVKKWRLLLFA